MRVPAARRSGRRYPVLHFALVSGAIKTAICQKSSVHFIRIMRDIMPDVPQQVGSALVYIIIQPI